MADEERPAPPPARRRRGIPADETSKNAARLVLEGGGTQAMAAQAAGVTPAAVSRWVQIWESEGWQRPFSENPDVHRTAAAREKSLGRWEDHRVRVGVKAGLVAERLLGRITQLDTRAGESERVVEQALDQEGRPTGVPRIRLLTPVPSAEIQRLADAATRLYQIADKSIGLGGNQVDVTVNTGHTLFAAADEETTDERRRRVLDIWSEIDAESGVNGYTGPAANGHNGQNGHGVIDL